MNRAERLAAGWTEHRTFRIRVRDNKAQTCWLADGSGGTIFTADRREVAKAKLIEMKGFCYDKTHTYTIVPFVTWEKPPPKPALKLGDSVLVRAKVVTVYAPGSVQIQTASGHGMWFVLGDIVEVCHP